MNLDNFSALLNLAFTEWRVKQTRQRAKTSIDAFADHLEFSRPIVNLWLNGDRVPSKGNVQLMLPKLLELLGYQVYIALDIPSPDPDLAMVNMNWPNVSEELRQHIKEEIAEYLSGSENNENGLVEDPR